MEKEQSIYDTRQAQENKMAVKVSIFKSIDLKKLGWYRYVKRMSNERWPTTVNNIVPPNKKRKPG